MNQANIHSENHSIRALLSHCDENTGRQTKRKATTARVRTGSSNVGLKSIANGIRELSSDFLTHLSCYSQAKTKYRNVLSATFCFCFVVVVVFSFIIIMIVVVVVVVFSTLLDQLILNNFFSSFTPSRFLDKYRRQKSIDAHNK
jgi:ABC-type uncharacterized transport system fused permease/ATPase subunit